MNREEEADAIIRKLKGPPRKLTASWTVNSDFLMDRKYVEVMIKNYQEIDEEMIKNYRGMFMTEINPENEKEADKIIRRLQKTDAERIKELFDNLKKNRYNDFTLDDAYVSRYDKDKDSS